MSKYNLLFCSAGRRVKLLRNVKETLGKHGAVYATDLSPVAPALYEVDRAFLVPSIKDESYFPTIEHICFENEIRAITTLIDPEIEILASKREQLERQGILPLVPSQSTAHLCFNKYEMFKFLASKGVRTVLTYDSLDGLKNGIETGQISFPVFMKPISGSGSVGIGKVHTWEEAEEKFNDGKFQYIIQELMTEGDCDADVYVDYFSHKPVSIFAKKKIESRIGGASKTISFKDEKLFNFIEKVCDALELCGPCDMDFFMKGGEYYLSEINPRFGGAYLHAYGAGVDFIKLIMNNLDGKENDVQIGQYDKDVVMMMFDDVVVTSKDKLLSTDFTLL